MSLRSGGRSLHNDSGGALSLRSGDKGSASDEKGGQQHHARQYPSRTTMETKVVVCSVYKQRKGALMYR